MTLENQALHLEVERLETENAGLKARELELLGDLQLFGGAMRELVMSRLGEEAPHAGEIEAMIRRAVTKADDDFAALTAEVAKLKEEVTWLTEERDGARRDRDRAMSQRDSLFKAMGAVANFVTSRQTLAMELLADPATADEGGGACQ